MAVRRSARTASAAAASQTDATPVAVQSQSSDNDDTVADNDPAANAGPTTSKPLKGCAVFLSGNFVSCGHNLTSMKRLVSDLGGTLTSSFTKATTHVIVPENQVSNGSAMRAHNAGIHVLDPKWVLDCQGAKRRLNEAAYDWHRDDSKDANTDGQPATNGNSTQDPSKSTDNAGKRTHAASDSDDDTKKPQAKKPKAAPKAKAKADVKLAESEKAGDEPVAEGQFVKKKDHAIAIDEFCPLRGYQIYVDPDSGMIYDASLNQSNSGRNNNKFYKDQIVFNPTTKDFKTWTRWGRVGDVGQNALLGDGSQADAIKHFEKKFKDKSGLKWADRGENPKPGKYAFVERSYEPDSESEDDTADGVKKEEAEDTIQAKCTLEKPIQDLVELIFNQAYFNQTMASLNYDANKLPLGKLSKTTILRGFQQLKDLSALMDDQSLAASNWNMGYNEAIEHLSNTYYSLIPHNFGRNRPPVIKDDTVLKKELELLESLSDMKDAADIMKVDRKEGPKIHPLDRHFQGLGLQEITTLDHQSQEFTTLTKYLNGTKGSTHYVDYKVQDIYRIERPGENERFEKSKFSKIASDRRLLWHGSRVTNFGGILSQGLRIAPPEAPVNGYMFGKGVYLADMSSKSAGYCASYGSGGNALLLLCDAELGDPMQRLTNADYEAGEKAVKAGLVATHGLGDMGPHKWIDASAVNENLKGVKMPDPDASVETSNDRINSLYYNEYIAYDVAQVRLRYLFRVKM